MAALTHLGVGLAAKRIAPKTPAIVLILTAYAIDVIWMVFYFAGIEQYPGSKPVTTNPWSHGLFMALVWSLLIGLIAFLVSRSRRAGWVAGLLAFSHWVVDFISHPMRAAFPNDTKLSLLFDGSPTVGLGLWSTQLGVISVSMVCWHWYHYLCSHPPQNPAREKSGCIGEQT
jgi:hypothetical protein